MYHEFEEIYTENAPMLYLFLLKLGCTADQAEDIMQDTFVKAMLSIDSFRGACKLFTWLCQIAKNLWFSELRKAKHSEIGISEQIANYEAEMNLHELFDLIESIEEPYRAVFALRAWVGLEFSEIAVRYGKTESWARVTYHRARIKLKQIIL